MAKNIDEAFSIFHSWLTPTKTETENAKSHRKSIEECIDCNFGLNRFFRTGSFGNGTSISGFSDVDYFASIPTSSLKQNSVSTLQQLYETLNKRFPNTGVEIDSPAIVVPFGEDNAETTEIVPADFVKKDGNGNHTYDIPNTSGGWMKASPDCHNLYVAYYNDELNKKVKPLIRFIKAWKYYNSIKISSFYLEIFVTRYASNEKVIVYTIDIKNIFNELYLSNLRPIPDPMEISGNITSDSDIITLFKLKEARDLVEAARTAELENRIEDAFKYWNKLYANGFPSYY
jgi:hypothetical protein